MLERGQEEEEPEGNRHHQPRRKISYFTTSLLPSFYDLTKNETNRLGQ
jgi:hypothetical protein